MYGLVFNTSKIENAYNIARINLLYKRAVKRKCNFLIIKLRVYNLSKMKPIFFFNYFD